MIHKLAAVVLLAASLTACSQKEAVVTARTGIHGGGQPDITCQVTVPNPDYNPSTERNTP